MVSDFLNGSSITWITTTDNTSGLKRLRRPETLRYVCTKIYDPELADFRISDSENTCPTEFTKIVDELLKKNTGFKILKRRLRPVLEQG